MDPAAAERLLDMNTQCANEEREIDDYPEYGFELDKGQKIRLHAFAKEIVRSHDSQSPVAAISIVGHADQALKLSSNPAEQKKKEEQVSRDRANHAEEQLLKQIKDLPGGDRVVAMIHTKAVGVGASDPAVPNPLNETQRRRNRRVVFKWSRCLLPAPIIHPPLEFPTPPGTDPEDDPNVVFAGNHFKVKIMDGVSVGEVAGGFQYEFAIWDIDNKRAAYYNYKGIIKSVGIPPFSECEESDWSDVLTTTSPIQVDQFSGVGRHTSGSIALQSGMEFTFDKSSFWGPKLKMVNPTVKMLAGPSKSLGIESGAGDLSYIVGTVSVFKGP